MMGKPIMVTLTLFFLLSPHALGQDLSYLKHKNRVHRIDAYSALLKYKTGNVILIDSMSPKTFAKYHILGAMNLCGDGPPYYRRILKAKIPISKKTEIIVYCD